MQPRGLLQPPRELALPARRQASRRRNLPALRDQISCNCRRKPTSPRLEFELASLKETLVRREREKADLLRNMDTYRRRLSLAPALEQELMALTRERTVLQTQYDNINQRKFNAQISMNAVTDKKNETYTILDKANLPGRPIPPTRSQLDPDRHCRRACWQVWRRRL